MAEPKYNVGDVVDIDLGYTRIKAAKIREVLTVGEIPNTVGRRTAAVDHGTADKVIGDHPAYQVEFPMGMRQFDHDRAEQEGPLGMRFNGFTYVPEAWLEDVEDENYAKGAWFDPSSL